MQQTIKHASVIVIMTTAIIIFGVSVAHAQLTTPAIGVDYIPCDSVSADGTRCIRDGVDVGPTMNAASLIELQQSLERVNNTYLGEDGLFSCKSGDQVMPVGTLTALGGTYVPVFDAAVTQNTGYLLYKECVLDGMVVKYRQEATAQISRAIINLVNTGDNGKPLFQTDPAEDRDMIMRRVYKEAVKNYNTEQLLPVFRDKVVESFVNDYVTKTGTPQRPYSYSKESEDSVTRFFSGAPNPGDTFGSLIAIGKNPANSPLFAKIKFQDYTDAVTAQRQADYQIQIINGIKPTQALIQVDVGNGETIDTWKTVTPAYQTGESLIQAVQTGFDQLQNASGVGEIVNSTFASLQTQILSSPQGLSGVSQPQAGQEFSFLDALVNIVSSIFGNSVANSALAIINSALVTEQEFYNYRFQAFNYLGGKRAEVLNAEKSCWINIEQAVRSIAGATPITVATSTEFAGLALGNSIDPLYAIASRDTQLSTTTISILLQLRENVTNSNSPSLQRIAISQIDALVANNSLHSQTDANNAKQSFTDIRSTVGPSLDDTIAAWATTTTSSTGTTTRGWCNTNDSVVVQSWFETWKQ